jgi:AraC family transcriptional regulator of adaptative response/methylated-DNA-[protein]-cysteine methyltransferase
MPDRPLPPPPLPPSPATSVAPHHVQAIERACRLIERCEGSVVLADLAAEAGFSPFRFHRLFRQVTGVTPRAWQKGLRMARVGEALHAAGSITEAYHSAGFGSSGRFYENAGAMLGMSPGAFRNRGRGERIRHSMRACVLGQVLVAATDLGVCVVEFGDRGDLLEASLRSRFDEATFVGTDATFEAWLGAVLAGIALPRAAFDLPLDIRGTAFQQTVWQALRAIPPGSTASYSEVAERIGRPGAARAVARACAGNSLALLVPCHRVVRGDGGLGGYRWGIERKQQLLARERR